MSYAPPSHDSTSEHPSIQEATGPVTSDSLAAESREFKSANSAAPLSVKGSNSTFATTDTSGATTLPPASSGPARPGQEQFTNKPPPSASSYNTSVSSKNAETAPSYVNSQYKDTSGQEGDFSSGMKNASFGGGEVGGKDDPARLAVDGIVSQSAGNAGLAGVPSQKGDASKNPYEELGGDTQA